MEEKKYEAIVEAILFTMGESVELERIAKTLELDTERTKKIIEHLMQRYEGDGVGVKIMELDGSYQMCTHGARRSLSALHEAGTVSVSDPGGQAAEEAGPDGCGDGDAVNHCLQAADYKGGN